jgi:hypothetical protein
MSHEWFCTLRGFAPTITRLSRLFVGDQGQQMVDVRPPQDVRQCRHASCALPLQYRPSATPPPLLHQHTPLPCPPPTVHVFFFYWTIKPSTRAGKLVSHRVCTISPSCTKSVSCDSTSLMSLNWTEGDESDSCPDRWQGIHHECSTGDGQFGRVLHLSRSVGSAMTNVEETTDELRKQSLLEAGKPKHMFRLPRGFGDALSSESDDSGSEDDDGAPEPGASEGEMIGAVGVSTEGQVKLYELEELPRSALLTVRAAPPAVSSAMALSHSHAVTWPHFSRDRVVTQSHLSSPCACAPVVEAPRVPQPPCVEGSTSNTRVECTTLRVFELTLFH